MMQQNSLYELSDYIFNTLFYDGKGLSRFAGDSRWATYSFRISNILFYLKVCNFVKTEDIMSNIEMTAIFEPCDEGGYIAYIEEIPGINSQGETIEEAKENLTDAINLIFEERRESQKSDRNKSVKKLITQTLSFSL